MANRRTLHKTHLQEFKIYLQGRGISYREGKGSYQVLQVMTLSKGWKCVHEKNDMKEHFTIQDDLEMLVIGFYAERREDKKSTGSVIDEKQHMLQEIQEYEVENKKQSERIKELEEILRDFRAEILLTDDQKDMANIACVFDAKFESVLKKD